MPTYVHPLKKLDEEKSWQLFSSKALPPYKRSGIRDVDEFEELGRILAKKCDGLPLPLAVLGGYLSKKSKYRSMVQHTLGLAVNQRRAHDANQGNLVQIVDETRELGRISSIRIHDILRDWCIEEARKDGFIDVMDKTTGQDGASSLDKLISYRSCFQTLSDEISPGTPNVRTLLCFKLSSVSLPKLRFLRVLLVDNSRLEDFSRVIGGCIHLRYLRLLNCQGMTLPSSIGQLLYLQTIDLRDTELDSVVPNSLWDISSLKHVFLANGFSPPPPARSLRRQQQNKLQTYYLSSTQVGTNWYHDMVIFVGQMKQLTRLSLWMKPLPAEMINIFANMPHLVDIYLSRFDVLDKLPDNFPQRLQNHRLYANVIEQDPMPILEKLPCLVMLGLGGYQGQTMTCSAKGFPRLQTLQLVMFSTEEWTMEDGTMPKLSCLQLFTISKMIKLPQGLLHLPSIDKLELRCMPQISGDDSTLKELQRKGCEVIW